MEGAQVHHSVVECVIIIIFFIFIIVVAVVEWVVYSQRKLAENKDVNVSCRKT